MHDVRLNDRLQLKLDQAGCGSAPDKVLLFGEHFVVHGAPAFGAPLASRGVEVEMTPGSGTWSCSEGAEPHLRAMVRHLGADPASLSLTVRSTLPIGAGLGSSAALAVALVRALAGVRGRRPKTADGAAGSNFNPEPKFKTAASAETDRVRALAHELEGLAHGNPSGVDDTIAAWGAPVWFVRGEPPEPLPALAPPPLWVALTPKLAPTKESVAHVGRFATEQPARFASMMADASRLAHQGRAAVSAGDWPRLGALMNPAHDLLVALGLSTPRVDAIVAAALSAGAYGVKITGAGMGGAVIAVAPSGLNLEPVLLKAGATEVLAP